MSYQLFDNSFTHYGRWLFELILITQYRSKISFIFKSRSLIDTRGPAEGLVHHIHTRLPWQSSSVSPPTANHQAIHPHEHLTHTSSPSIITILQSVLHPAFATEVSRHRSSITSIQLTTYPDSLLSRSSPSLHKFHNTPRSVQPPSVPAPASFHWEPLVYIDDQIKISNQPRAH